MADPYERLRQYVFSLEIFDTHEHMPGFEHKRPKHDVLSEYLIHYFSCDLVSAGLTPADLEVARDSSKPLLQRWRLVEPYWQAARNTGYGRALDLAARDLYGLGQIDRKTIGPLNEAFTTTREKGGWYQTVLKDKSKIRLSVLDADFDCDRRFFRPTARLDDFIMVSNLTELEALQKRAGAPIHTLDDLVDACEKVLEKAVAGGMCCLKSGLAYQRPLLYRKAPAAAAEEQFNAIREPEGFSRPNDPRSMPTSDLQDFMMHRVCRLADARGLTFQIHTGLQEGNGNYIAHSDPSLLTNLFLEYANVRFDCFHIGYPFQQTLAALAKNFRNVFVDFCWAHIISPAAATAALDEYLDSVPANKISGFGGDYCFVDGVYGHQVIARQDVARALAGKVARGDFDLDRAGELARMILHDNPAALFGLAEPAGKGRPATSRRERRKS